MESNHTPAPWYSDQDGFIYTERDDEDQLVVAKAHEHPRMNATLMNARRIVACVNACEGIETSVIETMGLPRNQQAWRDWIAERDALKARERELVEALQNWRTWYAEHFEDFSADVNAQLLCLDNDAAVALGERP